MPLSEHEQRLFEQIERSLAEDPKFASAVRPSDPKFHARRAAHPRRRAWSSPGWPWWSTASPSKNLSLGVVGFVVMLAAAAFAMQSHRRSQPRRAARAVGRHRDAAAQPRGAAASSTGWRTAGGDSEQR